MTLVILINYGFTIVTLYIILVEALLPLFQVGISNVSLVKILVPRTKQNILF